MLERPAFQIATELAELMRMASRLAGRPVRLSGSGSTMFTAFDERSEAEHFARAIDDELGIETRIVQPVQQVCRGDTHGDH